MPIPKGPLDSPIANLFLGQIAGYIGRWIEVQEMYLVIAQERWTVSKELTPERIQQSNRHMDIQEQRIELQRQKFVAEHGNWPGIDLTQDDPE